MTTEPPLTIHVMGRGIVGSRIHRMLRARSVVLHDGRWPHGVGTVAGDVVVLAHGGRIAAQARDLLERGVHVVTMGDSLHDTLALLDALPPREDVSLVVGAATAAGASRSSS